MVRSHVPAWCEQRRVTQPDGRYTVVCYFTRDGHPVAKAFAERVEITEYAPDGTPLRTQEGIVTSGQRADSEIVFTATDFQFSG